MRTGSEHSPVNTVRGPTFLRSEIAKTQFVLAHICTGRAIWWSASSTESSNAGASLPGMTNSPQTTLPSSSSQPFGFGYALLSPRPSSACSRSRVVDGRASVRVFGRSAAIAGPLAFGRLRDDEGVPVICLKCQIVFQSIHAGGCRLPCMGLFSIFLVGSQNRVCAEIMLKQKVRGGMTIRRKVITLQVPFRNQYFARNP